MSGNTDVLMKTKIFLVKICIWILFSIITGISCAAWYVTGGNITQFYNRGDSLQFYTEKIVNNLQNISFENEKFIIQGDTAQIIFDSLNKNNQWNYLKTDLYNMNCDSITAQIVFYDRTWQNVGEQELNLMEGENLYQLNGESFSKVVFCFENEQGKEFSINKFEISTDKMKDDEKLPAVSVLFSIICMIITGILYWLKIRYGRKGNYKWGRGLQSIYILVGNEIWRKLRNVPEKMRNFISIFLFSVMFIFLSFINVYNLFFKKMTHAYTMFVLIGCMLLIAGLNIRKPLKYRNWNNLLVISWIVLWVLTCISDFIVTKKSAYFSFYGYFILFPTGFLFFVWNNQENREKMLWQLLKALEITFVLCVVYCLMFRPETDGYRYKGFYTNPNPFGLYMAVMIGVFLCEIDYYIKCKEVKILKILPYAIGLTTAFFFLKKTQSTTATLAILCGALCWGIEKILKRHMKKTMIAVMCFVICYIPVSMGLQWGITNISEAIGTQIVYPVDYEYASVRDLDDLTGTIHVYAAEREDMSQTSQRIRQKLLNSNSINGLFSGRLYHYSTYLSQMNLFGHTKRATVYGSNINSAHNGVLAYAHMYGVYIIVPYIMMFVGYFSRAVRYCKSAENRNYYACLPLIIYVVFFLENMMDNVDIPFHWIVWFVFILLGGFLFPMREEEKV